MSWTNTHTHTRVCIQTHTDWQPFFPSFFLCVFLFVCFSVPVYMTVCLCVCVCETGVAVQFCQLYGLVLAEGRSSPPLTPICPVRVSHKVRSLLIVPVPDGRFMEDESEGLIRFPVLFGAKVSSFLNTFSTTLSITLNSSANRKLQKRLASFVGLHMHVCLC